jgi:cytochrome c553
MTNKHFRGTLAIALLAAAGLLAGCSGADTPAEHSGADRAAGHTRSSAGLPAGHVDAGEQRATTKNEKTGQACVDCHGEAGNAPIDPTYPMLGGQYHDYLAHSLQLYRDGDRSNAIMASQAADLTDQEIADLAAYFAAQPSRLKDLSSL